METIVVGVDGSDASVNALRWALREARLRTARVRVVLAWSYPQVSTYHEAKRVLDVPFAEDAAAFLDQVVAETAAAAEGLEIEKKVVEGQAAPALVEAARDASLLVVGSRGLGGFSGLLLGSVSQQCAHHADLHPRDRSRGIGRVTDVVSLQNLTKSYGRARGVVDLDLTVRSGEVFGFLGPNGAGKTTTMRTMLDLIRPTSGRVLIFGLDARTDGVAVRRGVGYLPGDLRLYEHLTPRELLSYFAALRKLSTLAEAERLATRLELEARPSGRCELSRGNRQKVGLVQAFMHRPQLLVLDEPTSGLDPLVQQTFYELAREAAAEGRTIFLSSHVISEVQHVADRVGLVREGRLCAGRLGRESPRACVHADRGGV